MSNIYLSGVDLPKNEPGAFEVIVMYRSVDGKIRAEHHGTHEVFVIPPHGRLIDAWPIMKYITDGLNSADLGYDAIKVMTEIEYAPTIIPAEEGE